MYVRGTSVGERFLLHALVRHGACVKKSQSLHLGHGAHDMLLASFHPGLRLFSSKRPKGTEIIPDLVGGENTLFSRSLIFQGIRIPQ